MTNPNWNNGLLPSKGCGEVYSANNGGFYCDANPDVALYWDSTFRGWVASMYSPKTLRAMPDYQTRPKPNHEGHKWVSADNEIVKGAEMCLTCYERDPTRLFVRPAEQLQEPTPDIADELAEALDNIRRWKWDDLSEKFAVVWEQDVKRAEEALAKYKAQKDGS